jgi:hypothetical protein
MSPHRWLWYAGTSFAVHGALLVALHATPPSAETPKETKTEFFPVELPKPRPKEPPKTQKPEAPKAEVPKPEPARPRAPSPPTPAPANVSAQAAPVRLGGLGLSNAGFVFAAGDASQQVSNSGGTRPAPTPEAPPAPRAPEGPPLVKVADLSERPTPPVLDGSLRQNYPKDLERQGIEGDALLRLTLSVTGKVVDARAVSQSHVAFAEACRKTLIGSAWSPPRDRSGKPVRTSLDYRCRFRVSR